VFSIISPSVSAQRPMLILEKAECKNIESQVERDYCEDNFRESLLEKVLDSLIGERNEPEQKGDGDNDFPSSEESS